MFLLPRLQQRLSALLAFVIVGLHWALWHRPLFVLGDGTMAPTSSSFVAYVGSIIGVSIVLTWLFNATRGASSSRCSTTPRTTQ
ncbi:CPBP family glutamic-type intramembrane protease [Halobaculum limi]|uniref:CPBP family glutamic-type intramembrane protease n=1 Tax=Halobaculum limi TaxID=3031916 RepID=UPI003D80B055